MFKVSTEFRKGVLFVRLVGRLKNADYLKELDKLIEEIGIFYIVLNLNGLNDISLENINYIIDYYQKLSKKKRKLIICDKMNKRERLFKNIIPKITNELEVFSFI